MAEQPVTIPHIELEASFSTAVLDLDNISTPVTITLSTTLKSSKSPIRIFPRDTIFDTKAVVLRSWIELFEVDKNGHPTKDSVTLRGNKTEVFYGDPDTRFTRHVDISDTLVLSPGIPHNIQLTLGPIPRKSRPSEYNFVRLPSDWQRGKYYSIKVNPEARVTWWQQVDKAVEDKIEGKIDVPDLPSGRHLSLDIGNRPTIWVE